MNSDVGNDGKTASAGVSSSNVCVSNVSNDSVNEDIVYVNDSVEELDEYAAYSVCWDDCKVEECSVALEVIAMLASSPQLSKKFDTACSRSCSGVSGRLRTVDVGTPNIVIKGFNDSESVVKEVGFNKDDITEYFVEGMPPNLVLYCANDYVQGGAAVLFPDDGVVLRLTTEESDGLRKFVEKNLTVKNRTYEVVDDNDDVAYASTNYFNTKVNVNTKEERVLSYLLTGLTLRDIQCAIRNGSVTGFHPELQSKQLSNFESKWGRSPDVIQMAYPNKLGNEKGYMSKPHVYSFVGERIEIDFMECDFNEDSIDTSVSESNSVFRKKVKKLASFGGAVAAWVSYDVYSGFVYGRLVKSVAKAVDCVKELVEYYEKYGHKVCEIAADRGIITEGKYRINTPETIAYCSSKGIRTKGAEPYNHSNGTPHVERVIQVVENMIRSGTHYMLQNPNLTYLKYTKRDILMLWGELFMWAMSVIPMKESPKNEGVSRHKLFYNVVPNIQEIRLLPIFSVLLVYRHVPNVASLDGANRPFYQYGLYVGPDTMVSGAIRVAVKANGVMQIIVSSKYKCVTDGGSVNIYPSVQRGLRSMLEGEAQEEKGEAVDCTPTAVPDPVPVAGDNAVPTEPESIVSNVMSTPVIVDNVPELRGDAPVTTTNRSKAKQTYQMYSQSRKEKKVAKKIARKEIDRSSWASREERARKRREFAGSAGTDDVAHFSVPVPKCSVRSIETGPELIDACFADWSTHEDHYRYYSVVENVFYTVTVEKVYGESVMISEGYRAVTKGVPKTYNAALVDTEWGDAARKEWETLVETKALLLVDTEVARQAIRNGSDLVVLFPVYEEKEKEGKLVRKVRLVGDGRTHYSAGSTYSPTPSREELLVILHMAAKYDWDIVHIDEVRAFLNATYKGDKPVYTKMKGDDKYYEVLKALYGLKSSPKDYNTEVKAKLTGMGFTPLLLSSQLYIFKDETGGLVIIYDFVDDFVITGNKLSSIMSFIDRFRKVTNTTEPAYNPAKLLGMELERDRAKRIIKVSMKAKIKELVEKYNIDKDKEKDVPIPKSQYIVKEYDYDDRKVVTETNAKMLDNKGITVYMQVVGSLIWLTGVRIDIIFATTYLAWYTKAPRQHHLNMCMHVVSYLHSTVDVPLVLGGTGKFGVQTESDASLGTGPKGRSVLGQITRLGDGAGAVTAKATASTLTHCSSFEAELDACSRGMKTIQYISNIIKELGIEQDQPVLYCDNEAMVNFVKSDGVAKGVRHMELRMWYTREQYRLGNSVIKWRSGATIAADKLTKLADKLGQSEFRYSVQGLYLLNDD